jgi:hypothetical protein
MTAIGTNVVRRAFGEKSVGGTHEGADTQEHGAPTSTMLRTDVTAGRVWVNMVPLTLFVVMNAIQSVHA